MSSLDVYKNFLIQNKNPYISSSDADKLSQINNVVQNVLAELNSPPFSSPFVEEIRKTVHYIEKFPSNFSPQWKSRVVRIADAFAVVRAVCKTFANRYYRIETDESITSLVKSFFKEAPLVEKEKELIAGIKQDLEFIQAQNKNQQEKIKPVVIPAKSVEKNAPPFMQEYAEKKAAQIELQKYLAEIEKERTKNLELRRADNAKKLDSWQQSQVELLKTVRELQAPAQKLLEDFRNFSRNLTENYILQFAQTQIDLFNLISGNLNSHLSRAEKSQNKDYIAAVKNYSDFLEMIVDALAEFGVEEISSEVGTHFDGKFHNVKNTKIFNPQTATISKSLRAGFKYGSLILQKEEVEV